MIATTIYNTVHFNMTTTLTLHSNTGFIYFTVKTDKFIPHLISSSFIKFLNRPPSSQLVPQPLSAPHNDKVSLSIFRYCLASILLPSPPSSCNPSLSSTSPPQNLISPRLRSSSQLLTLSAHPSSIPRSSQISPLSARPLPVPGAQPSFQLALPFLTSQLFLPPRLRT